MLSNEKSRNFLTKMISTRHRISKEFQDMKRRAIEVSERRMRYKVDEVVTKPGHTAIDLRLLSLNILSQVGFVAPEHTNMETWGEDGLISTLQNFLTGKRYFIVIDDIWDGTAWNIIRCALPETMNDPSNEVLCCRVHDMMLDLIEHKCREENFITVTDDLQAMAGLPNKVRRLSLYLDGVIDDTVLGTTQLSQVRALARFGTSTYAPRLSDFKHLRVLTLEFPSGNHGPKILDLTDVVNLRRLLHLVIPQVTHLPSGIGNMKSLRTLREFSLGLNSVDTIRDLGDLTTLRDLQISSFGVVQLDDVEKGQRMDVLRHSLEKLCSLPQKPAGSICGACYREFPSGLQLHSLLHLRLHVERTLKDKVTVCGSGFPVLNHFIISYIRISNLTFEAGAMPKLQRLEVRFNEQYGAAPVGIENLSGLTEFSVSNGGYNSSRSVSQSALRNAMDMHPCRPAANFNHRGSSQFLRRLDDGFSWRKYGMKEVLGASRHPRSYYRCTHKNTRGCLPRDKAGAGH
uniref:Uncharacterized protein n=1 Tax=Avena sativa TaxID=4498 RepID=A0ACD5W9A6_AVESA